MILEKMVARKGTEADQHAEFVRAASGLGTHESEEVFDKKERWDATLCFPLRLSTIET
jgi:hypothetical protein